MQGLTMELTDGELDHLWSILEDQMDDDRHMTGLYSQDDGSSEDLESLVGKVRDEAKRRKFWWA